MTDILLASKNRHKIAELETILSQTLPDIHVHSLGEVGFEGDIEENGTTFSENALIKALAAQEAARAAGRDTWLCVGDDSGLAVDALNGAPGIFSARYAGEHGNDRKNNEKLLGAMADIPDGKRTARFICCLALVFPDGRKVMAEGRCEGSITREAAGEGGFGYDPVFYVPECGKTFSELTSEQKNAISHRGAAIRNLAEKLVQP